MNKTVISMRRSLAAPVTTRALPPGLRFAAFDDSYAQELHDLFAAGYANGFGDVGAFDVWWRDLLADAEYEPELVFLVIDADDEVVAGAQCWTTAFIKDIAVRDGWRGRGVGDAMLARVCEAFRERGAAHVDLKVEPGNAAARRFYGRNGFAEVAA